MEELARAYESGFAMALHSDIIVPYIYASATRSRSSAWLPGWRRGELVTALAMTEPGTGSDLAAIATTAVQRRRRLRHQRREDVHLERPALRSVHRRREDRPDRARAPGHLALRRRGGPQGLRAGQAAPEDGHGSQDTRELFFEDCRVPAANLLGAEGAGFMMLMQKLQQERLCVAIGAVGGGRAGARRTRSRTPRSARRSASRSQVPEHAVQARRVRRRRSRSAARSSTTSRRARRRQARPGRSSMAKFWTTDMQRRSRRHVPAVLRRLRLHARVPGHPRLQTRACRGSTRARTRS